jgi:hypothetical protein
VPVIGRGDGDGVDVFGGEEFAEVFIGSGSVAERFFGLGDKSLQDVAFYVADVGDLCVLLVRLD